MAKILTAALLTIAMLCHAEQAVADFYQWVDQNGVVHFSDTPPASGQNAEIIQTPDYPSPSPSSAPAQPPVYTEPIPETVTEEKGYKEKKRRSIYANEVEIFTTSWCGYCKKAIAFLRSHSIEFQQYDVEKDPNAAARMYALGGTGPVPFAVINGKQILGFSEYEYKRALGLR